MRVDHLPEPELEFGAGRHIDIRFGLMNHGPLDFESAVAPKQIKLGVVGTPETIEGVQQWLERCRSGIAAKPSKRPNLFPRFPGFGPETRLVADLVLDSRLQRAIPQAEFDHICRGSRTDEGVTEAVRLFVDEIEYLTQKTAADVFLCALPLVLVEYIDQYGGPEMGSDNQDGEGDPNVDAKIEFHDLLKAKVMRLCRPTQIVRPATYDETKKLRRKSRRELTRNLQDEATRAWNFYTALYYKAGGIPWRLVRDPKELSACYVGVSFYKTVDESKLLTSSAQVFNERGEGVILRGGTAKLTKDDRQIHLTKKDAHTLLVNALEVYRREHKTFPARVVVHKTSIHNDDEIEGFREALRHLRIEEADFVSVTDSTIRLLRSATYPPLRGTLFATDSELYVLYTKGSVDFFAAYPGLYVPRPFAFRCDAAVETPRFIAQEILALTKMNWNNTQFDGGEPITTMAARQVGQILKHVAENESVEPHYRYYM